MSTPVGSPVSGSFSIAPTDPPNALEERYSLGVLGVTPAISKTRRETLIMW